MLDYVIFLSELRMNRFSIDLMKQVYKQFRICSIVFSVAKFYRR